MAMQLEAPVLEKPTTDKRLITGDELAATSGLESVELVRGEIVHRMPINHLHGYIEFLLGRFLGNFVYPNALGRVIGGETGIYTRRNPDTVRGVDVAFVSNERLQEVTSSSYLDVAPELIVEVMSPTDAWSEVNEKLAEYSAIGVKLVWVVDPRLQLVHIYRSLEDITVLRTHHVLTGEDILPGLEIPLSEIFPQEI
jgi:Uma2 family endonuclease